MPSRPVIGVSTQTLQAIDGIPAGLPQSVVMNQRYYAAVAVVGAAPVLIPLLEDDPEALRGAYEACDGILIPGGVDVDPQYYGEAAHDRLGRIDPARDVVELELARWAVEDRKPLLGVCRGMQVLNVALGGSLWQDLADQCPQGLRHDYFPTHGFTRDHLAHDVAIVPGTRLHAVLGRDRVAVNSMHHQGVKRLAPSLVASAHAPDGLVEAAERPGEPFCVGVQWHPEVFDLALPETLGLFRAFVAAATRYRG